MRGESEQIWDGVHFRSVCFCMQKEENVFNMQKNRIKLKKYTDLCVKSMDFFVVFY